MLRSGKNRLSDFPRLWLELDDHIAAKRRTLYVGTGVIVGVLVVMAVVFAITVGGDAVGAVCSIGGFLGIFGCIVAFTMRSRINAIAEKVEFAKAITEALADDYHPARKINYYLDLRPYDANDKQYWSGRSMHGNSKYRYRDRWFRQKFVLIDGTRVVVERKSDHKVRKGSLIRHKRRVYVKVYPNAATFGAGPYEGTENLETMVREAIRASFHDPPEVIRVRREGPRDHISLAVTQLDAPILGREVVALVEAVLLYLRLLR
ncbi:MAG: hypothetical protein R3F61_35800 [Myxococcota bacterium]